MDKKTCENCERVIGNLEESFFYKNHVVCRACKTLLEEESQTKEVAESNAETRIPIVEALPQGNADAKHESTSAPIQQNRPEKKYGGIRRGAYLFGLLGTVIFQGVLSFAAHEQGDDAMVYLGLIITIPVNFILVMKRLQNIGKSGWWSLLWFVPIANFFVSIPCAIFPEGYQDTRKIDTAGKIIACFLLIWLVFAVVFVITNIEEMDFSRKASFADVVEPILNARSVTYDMIIDADDANQVIHETIVGSRIHRAMSNLPNLTLIIDLDDGKMLVLDAEARTAFYMDFQLQGRMGDNVKFLHQIIAELQENPNIEELGEQVIDGQKAVGFKGTGPNESVTIWADPKTALPIRIEAEIGQEFSFIMKNFEFDAAVDESLMSMDVPDGYTLQETGLDLGNSNEEDFVESLRIWAEIIGDGTFPESIGTQSAMAQMPVLIQKVAAMQVSEEKGTEIGIGFAKGMLFHQILENQGAWNYAGAGVKHGDANTAIFWYQPQGSATYRVIYGDLSVKDVAAENLPK